MRKLWIVFVLLGLVSCNLPADRISPTPFSTLVADTPISNTSTPTLVPIETLLALPTATYIPTPTSDAVMAAPLDQPVNCRYGPSVAYSVIGSLDLGRQAEIVGRSGDSGWWYVRNPNNPSTFCWLSAAVSKTVGNVQGLPVIDAPVATVTRIDVSVEPVTMSVPCKSFPYFVTATAQFATNGPTKVGWRWETNLGEAIARDPLLFLEGGSETEQILYRVNGVGNFWIQAHAFSPNDVSGIAYFKVTCVQ